MARLYCTEDPLPKAWIELWWSKKDLLTRVSGWRWPILAVNMDGQEAKQLRVAVHDATTSAVGYGMDSTWQHWVRFGQVVPVSEPIDIDEYAENCSQRLRNAWLGLHEVINKAVRHEIGTRDTGSRGNRGSGRIGRELS